MGPNENRNCRVLSWFDGTESNLLQVLHLLMASGNTARWGEKEREQLCERREAREGCILDAFPAVGGARHWASLPIVTTLVRCVCARAWVRVLHKGQKGCCTLARSRM